MPKIDIYPGDIVNENYYKTGSYSWWNKDYCNLSTEYYDIERQKYTTYKKIADANYVLIENVTYDENIKIFYDNEPVDFEIISTENNKIKINLKKTYLNELLLFFVDTSSEYKISTYGNKNFEKEIISKEIKGEKISVPDQTWVTDKTIYYEIRTTSIYENSSLTTKLFEEEECRYREISVYKYDIEREYYDENYHLNVDGYIKDINDYKVFYKGEPIIETITNNVEIPVEVPVEIPIEVIKEKIVKEPQIEYVYIEKESDSSNQEIECLPDIITEIQKEIVETEISKIPKIVYIIIFLLILVIFILAIKLYKKYVV